MNIIEAIRDEKVFRPFLEDVEGGLGSWRNWMVALRASMGLPITAESSKQLIRQCTGRDPDLLPENGFSTSLFLTGRRSGKSRVAAVTAAYQAVLSGREKRLSKGEQGLVVVCSVSKRQGSIIKGYTRSIFKTPLLAQEVVEETREGFTLRNGVRIEILAGDFRTVRGFTLLAAIVDEAAFFGTDEESKVKSDTELIRAIKPALATTGGPLLLTTSPYARKGFCWETHKKHWGNDKGTTLVWNAASRVMNPTLPQSVIDEAMQDDLAAAKSEFGAEFREDVGIWLPRAVIEGLVVAGRRELAPVLRSDMRYFAFADLSGGRSDDSALAIAHREDRKVVVDYLGRWRPPSNPYDVIRQMSKVLKEYGIRVITGDNYAAEFCARAFEACGIGYLKCPKPKSQLYLELLPRMCSGEVELLDDDHLVNQLAGLERRTRSGGKDSIDHPHGGHDDLANVIAGVADLAGAKVLTLGGFDLLQDTPDASFDWSFA
ncbi:hypothetical protein Pan44_02560 [Caulifigura coniformis]|uniref:Terminase-like family protein n=1 Tax=Caulifigura coniformis TaxID=2527983 RepID=A0A517S807_9PLAN|nr:hypothetical protein [Caulifigura coniformis]QDT52247.1 hypothetical protein Pan44_02560 [Caulifigura coniformis]